MSTAAHVHRCRRCRERVEEVLCPGPVGCAEGVRWVVLCQACYDELEQAIASYEDD